MLRLAVALLIASVALNLVAQFILSRHFRSPEWGRLGRPDAPWRRAYVPMSNLDQLAPSTYTDRGRRLLPLLWASVLCMAAALLFTLYAVYRFKAGA